MGTRFFPRVPLVAPDRLSPTTPAGSSTAAGSLSTSSSSAQSASLPASRATRASRSSPPAHGLPQGPGDTGGPGQNSAPNVQPKIACTKKDRTLEIQTTLGADQITITDENRAGGNTVVVKQGGQEIFSGPRADFDKLNVYATTGDVIQNRGSLKLVVFKADPTGVDTSAWVANNRLKIEGGFLVGTITVKKTNVDGKDYVDVLTNAGRARPGASASPASIRPTSTRSSSTPAPLRRSCSTTA